MSKTVLIVHGLGGSGPEHWQTLLASRLMEQEVPVSFPVLPDADEPSLAAWIDVLTEELERLGPDGLAVVCHSLGSVTWLHLAARAHGRLADRVLLVAPPSAGADAPAIAEFVPAPLGPEALQRAAGSTQIVCADAGDPYCPEGPEQWEALGVPIDLVPGGGHLNTDAGYGEWPAVEAWCLDSARTPIGAR